MPPTSAKEVHEVLSRKLLADGMPIVYDPEKSKGSRLYDARSDRQFVDLFGFFARGTRVPTVFEGGC